jgi:hypothetical protein
LQRGLAKIDTPLGMIVAYSTQAGTEADDGNGRNSPYTEAFLKNIEAEDEIGTIFRRVSSDVYETTSHRQLPELSLSLIGEFYLRGKLEVSTRPAVPANPPLDTTKEDFEAARSVDTPGAWNAFLAKHPDGYYASLAQERRAKLRATEESHAIDSEIKPQPPIGGSVPNYDDRYLALATSAGGSWGAVNSGGAATREEAESIALSSCQQHARDCHAAAWSKNRCLAAARGSASALGWSGAKIDIEDARREALSYCNKHDGSNRCKIVWSACAKPS